MKFILLTMGFCILATSAFAKTPNRKTSAAAAKTDTVFAPLYGQHEFVVGLTSPFGNTDATPVGQKIEYSGFMLQAQYAYGLLDFVSIYGAQNYTSYDLKYSNPQTTGKQTGIGNTTLGVKGIINFDRGPYAYYDASYSLGLADKAKYDASSRETTAVSRRPDMKFEGGGGMPLGVFGFGASVIYHMYQDGDTETTTANIKTITKDRAGTGLGWKVYGQIDMGWKLGVSYREDKVDEFNQVTNNVMSVRTATTTTAITVYGVVPVMSASEVIVSVSKPDEKEATYTTYNLYLLAASFRWIF